MRRAFNLSRKLDCGELSLRMKKGFGLFQSSSKFSNNAISSFENKSQILLISNKSYTFKLSKMETKHKTCGECKGPLLDVNTPDNRKVVYKILFK